MNYNDILKILKDVRNRAISPEDAYKSIIVERYKEFDSVVLDYERPLRTGFPEVIYGKDKSYKQIISIIETLYQDKKPIIITKLNNTHIKEIKKLKFDLLYINEEVGLVRAFVVYEENRIGKIVVATGGTSDKQVAEEASLIAESLGSKVDRMYDVGVAGIHRLLTRLDRLRDANVIIAIAGMEGALPSVIAGLVTSPVIAVPTSVGYGASLGGLSALLTMLNSCAPGISVVNIDNGFGAAYQANLINTLIERKNK
jgi:pyridinium-3,5-biscarboxylic acid mononucleotide synthase